MNTNKLYKQRCKSLQRQEEFYKKKQLRQKKKEHKQNVIMINKICKRLQKCILQKIRNGSSGTSFMILKDYNDYINHENIPMLREAVDKVVRKLKESINFVKIRASVTTQAYAIEYTITDN